MAAGETITATASYTVQPSDVEKTYTNKVEVSFDGGTTIEQEDEVPEIKKHEVTITAESDSKVYDGTPLTKDAVTEDYKKDLVARNTA